MITEKVHYELLMRWDKSGLLAGAHVQSHYVTRDGGPNEGGTVLGDLGPAEPVALMEEEAALVAALPPRLEAVGRG